MDQLQELDLLQQIQMDYLPDQENPRQLFQLEFYF